jgi:hypothetical protein
MAADPSFETLLQEGLNLPDEKQIYFNGFVVSMTPTDAVILLQRNNKPILSLNLSHTLAKTLATQLLGVIQSFEKETKLDIPTLDRVNEAIQNANKNRNQG